MKHHDRHEKKLVDEMSKHGFALLGITPFLNADKFYFYKKNSSGTINVELIYNGQGYCMSVGKNNSLKAINMKYQLKWEEVFENIKNYLGKKN